MLYFDAHSTTDRALVTIPEVKAEGDKVMIVTVSHFTHGWIQDCLNSLFVHCPEFPLLVVDNNPSKDDNKKRAKSYAKKVWLKNDYLERLEMCEIERDWIRNQKRITVLNTTNFMKHGMAIDMANLWAYENGIDTLIHVEPDCMAYGRMWIDTLMKAIRNGYWLACGAVHPSGILYVVPGAWSVKHSLNFSFRARTWEEDLNEKVYKSIVNRSHCLPWQRKKSRWDFGQKLFYEYAKLGKVVYVPTWDLKHFCMGSRGNYHPLQKEFIKNYNIS